MNYLRRTSGLWLPDHHLRFPPERGFAQPRYNFLPGHFPAGAVARAAEDGDTTINLAIVNVDDDAHDNNGSLQTGNNTVASGHITTPVTTEATAGFRFRNVNVPQGANISSATLTVEITNVIGSPNQDVMGVDEDDAAVWDGNVPSGAATTTASTNVMPGSTGSFPIDVTAQVQEIVNRAGWSPGNAMAFILGNNVGSGDNVIQCEALEAGNGNEATLDITFS